MQTGETLTEVLWMIFTTEGKGEVAAHVFTSRTLDTHPLPRLEDCIDRVGAAKYITKIDLKKGFWQVPLTERAKAVSCFVADGQTYRCNVMPFGMKNAPVTIQRLMNRVTQGLSNCVVYLDDVVILSDTWEQHLCE